MVTAGTSSAALDDRYGRRGGGAGAVRRRVAGAAGVLVAVALTWIVWVALDQADQPVRWTDGTFRTVDEATGEVTWTVTADPGTRVVCTLRAFNSGLTEVGRVDVDAGPSADSSFRVTARVPTFERATGGQVGGCAVR